MNKFFSGLILISFAFALYNQILFDPVSATDEVDAPMAALSLAVVDSAKAAVELSLGLVGLMAFFLGLLKIAELGGMLDSLADLLRPFLLKLFPDIPKDHPAMGSIIMNIAANMMGLGNAATPFGIKAMQELDTLNTNKGTATDSMILFLAINTSSVTLLPTGVIALRASAGSLDPAGILVPTLLATLCSTTVAVLTAKFFVRKSKKKPNPVSFSLKHYAFLSFFLSLVPAMILFGHLMSPYLVPTLISSVVLFGILKKVPVYEALVEGAQEGFQVAIKIIPYLVAILVGVGMFRASGALAALIKPLSRITELVGLPAEALPMALLRPFSGSGAYGILASTIQNPEIGPDSYIGYLTSAFQGSTETTFYVMAVYFGAVRITQLRHTLWVCLLADIAGIGGAVAACNFLFGHLI